MGAVVMKVLMRQKSWAYASGPSKLGYGESTHQIRKKSYDFNNRGNEAAIEACEAMKTTHSWDKSGGGRSIVAQILTESTRTPLSETTYPRKVTDGTMDEHFFMWR